MAIINHGKLLAFGKVGEILRQVRQERLIEVQLASADEIPKAIAVIAPRVEPDSGVTPAPAEASVRFRTQASEDDMGRLLADLIGAGVRVNQFREEPFDLEATFLSITRSSAPGGDQPARPDEAQGRGDAQPGP